MRVSDLAYMARPSLRFGVDFVVTLNGEVVEDAVAASTSGRILDTSGPYGWVETSNGSVRHGVVEFRLLAPA